MTIKVNIVGTVKSVKKGFKFFFVKPNDASTTAGVEIFTPVNLLKGIGAGRIGGGTPIVVEAFQQQDGRWRANRIVALGDDVKQVVEKTKFCATAVTKLVTTTVVNQRVGIQKHRNTQTGEVWWTVDAMRDRFDSLKAAYDAAGAPMPKIRPETIARQVERARRRAEARQG
jgi:hypothetical protein